MQNSHKQFLRRQRIYENKYKRRFYSYLYGVNKEVANIIEQSGTSVDVDSLMQLDKLDKIYRDLYNDVTISEGRIQTAEFDDPKTKDLIDDLSGILRFGEEQPISIWRRLLNEFLTVRIASRITYVTNTTRERISVLIERGIKEGLGGREVAKLIRDDKGYNRNRSLAIARTETVTATNQGKYLAAISSPYVKLKKWLPTIDNRTRPSHADFIDRPFVDFDQMFFVANADGVLESARYPCDSSLSASNTINCRCTLVFKNKLDSNGNPLRK